MGRGTTRLGRRRSKRVGVVVLAALLTLGRTASPTQAVAGGLDLGFGTNGISVLDAGTTEIAAGAVGDPVGRIVTVGTQFLGGNNVQLVVTRWTAKGQPDATFGTNGIVTSGVSGGLQGRAVAIGSDGKIVAAAVNTSGIWLVRFTQAGTLDTSFGSGGATLLQAGTNSVASMGFQSSGKIVLIGAGNVTRANSDGTIDTTFGVNGVASIGTVPISLGTIRSDDTIVVAGSSGPLKVSALTANGALDTTFGTSGTTTVALAFSVSARSIVAALDRSIAVGGVLNNPSNNDQVVLRLTPSGAPMVSFGTNGVATTDAGAGDDASGIAIQSDNKVVVGGTLAAAFTSIADGYAVRYLASGARDASFGSNGVAVVDTGQFEEPNALLIQPSGRVVLVGIRANNVGLTGADVFAAGLTSFDQTGLLGWWTGDGTLAAEVGPDRGGTATYASGRQGQGFQLGSATDLASLSAPAPTTAVSVEMWVRASVDPAALGVTQTLMARDDWRNDLTRAYSLMLSPNGKLMWITDETSTRRPEELDVAAPTLTGCALHHIVATWDQSQMSVYVDGVIAGSKVSQGGTLNPAPSTPLRIGASGGSSGGFAFNGTIDEPRVWGRALSSAEVSALYQMTPPLTGC